MQVVFEPVWSWPLALLVSAGLIGIVLITYPPRVRHLPPFSRRLLIGLRVLSALALVIGLLRPAVQFTEKDDRGAQLMVVMDKSRSMNTPDGPAGATRRESLVKTLAENAERFEKIGKTIDVQYLDFAEEVAASSGQPAKVGDGKYTAIGKMLDELRKDEAGKRLIGVILMSDGAQRATGEDDIDPRAAARRFVEQKGVAIYPVTFGSSDLSSVGMDLAIEGVTVDPLPFERKTVPVRAQVRVTGAAGRKVKARLLIENRSKKGNLQSGEYEEIPVTPEGRSVREFTVPQGVTAIPVDLSFVAQQAGEFKLAVRVDPVQDDPKELKVANNQVETLINVRKGGLKVAYFDIVRPEQKFLRRLNENAKVQLDYQAIPTGKMQARVRIEPRLFEKGMYDVYIIGDVPAGVFVTVDNKNLLDRLADRMKEGAGLLMIGGRTNFGAGGYAATKLADVLPIEMSTAEKLRFGEVAPDQHINRKLQMLPTPDGLAHFVMQVSVGDNEAVWKSLPPLDGATKLKPPGHVDVLARSPDGVPLLIANDSGRGRAMAFAGDSTFHWYQHGMKNVHQRFWEQMLLWLAHKENESDQPVWVTVEPRNFLPRGRAPIQFGAQDPATKKPLADATFNVEVLTPKGDKRTVVAQKAGNDSFAEFTETDEPGDYWVTVSAVREGKSYGLPTSTRFIVDARDAELDNPAADPELMSEIATLTGATTVTPEGFGEFLDRLVSEGVAAEMMRYTTVTLWDGWPLLLMFALLLTTEWFVRKRKGLV